MSYIIEFPQAGVKSIENYLRVVQLITNKKPTRNMFIHDMEYIQQWKKPIFAITYHWSFAYVGTVSLASCFNDDLASCVMAGQEYSGPNCKICPGYFKLDMEGVKYITSSGRIITKSRFLDKNPAVESYNHDQNCFGVSEFSRAFGGGPVLTICPIDELPVQSDLIIRLSVQSL